MTDDPIIGSDECAALLGCEPEHVEELARAGELPGLKMGRRWIFPMQALLGSLAEMGRRQMNARAERARNPWREDPAVRAARHARRRAAKIQRTPAWADLPAIRAIYREAQRVSVATNVPHHVDHEIPLQGKLVSGLHVHNNLQILTGSENSKKHNRFEVES